MNEQNDETMHESCVSLNQASPAADSVAVATPGGERLSKHPTLDRMGAVQTESQAIGEFIDWLSNRGLAICSARGERYFPDFRSIEQLLADYFEIDLDAAEQEKRALLDDMRAATEALTRSAT